MKNGVKMTLAILGVFLIICEFFYGIPFLGGSVILSFGWQPLLLNAFLYLIITIILLVDTQNSIKPMLIIPLTYITKYHFILFYIYILYIYP